MRRVQDFSMEAARLHAKLPAHRRAAERAIGRVRQALAAAPGTWAVGVSGGKDSAAMLDVCVEAGWRGPVFHFRYRGDYEHEQEAMARGLAGRFGLAFDCVEVPSEFEAFERVGRFFSSPETPDERAAARWWEREHKRVVHEHQRGRGWAGIFIGMRAEESRMRSMVLRRKGWLYSTQDRPGLTCCPLSDWSGRDVWARIAASGLPWLARYDDAEDRILERSEDIWIAPQFFAHGGASDIRQRSPEAFYDLAERFPGIGKEI